MDMNSIALVGAALLPAVALCIYIFAKDRVEKEPKGLLFLLLGLGAAICIPAAIIENLLSGIIEGIFTPMGASQNGSLVLPDGAYYMYQITQNFVGIALVEEALKFLVLVLVTRKNKHFNSFFDGIVYAVFVSLGFAAFENVLYVLENGWLNALLRAVLSVPGHMFFGVMMGYYYSLWHIKDKAALMERKLIASNPELHIGIGPKFSSKKERLLCLLVPVCFHGFYDFCCSIDDWYATLLLIGFVVFMYIYCFGKIRKVSRSDGNTDDYGLEELMKKYPFLRR